MNFMIPETFISRNISQSVLTRPVTGLPPPQLISNPLTFDLDIKVGFWIDVQKDQKASGETSPLPQSSLVPTREPGSVPNSAAEGGEATFAATTKYGANLWNEVPEATLLLKGNHRINRSPTNQQVTTCQFKVSKSTGAACWRVLVMKRFCVPPFACCTATQRRSKPLSPFSCWPYSQHGSKRRPSSGSA